MIAARVDLLDPASREALRRCSVMGRVFWPRAVGVDDSLIAALGRRALVSEHAGSAVAGMREFAFKHALTQDVAYSTLPRAERRELHRQVGTWVGDVAPGREAELAEIAAYHLDRALEYGDSSPDVRARACELSRIAGEAALARAAGESALSLLRRAVELAGGPRERALCLIGLGRAEQMVAPSDRDVEAFAAAHDAASASGDPRVLADALSWLSRAIWLSGRLEEALPAARAALEALSGLEETPQLARATARLSQLEMLGGLPQAERRARDAITLARRVGDTHAEVNARINLATALGPPQAGAISAARRSRQKRPSCGARTAGRALSSR